MKMYIYLLRRDAFSAGLLKECKDLKYFAWERETNAGLITVDFEEDGVFCDMNRYEWMREPLKEVVASCNTEAEQGNGYAYSCPTLTTMADKCLLYLIA